MTLLASNLCLINITQAGTPLWTFTPLTATTITLSPYSTATVQYTVTNQTNRSRVLVMRPVVGVTQLTGMGLCPNPFTLAANASCTLSLSIDDELLTESIIDGPIICSQSSLTQCYRPSAMNVLKVTKTSSWSNTATISVSGSPLNLDVNGSTGTLTITNISSSDTATNIASDFTSTALDGNVTETGNTCTSVSPMSSCTLAFTPGNTAVPQTSFNIAGANTNTITAAITISQSQGSTLSNISPSSGTTAGGTSFTLTGTDLSAVTSVTFGGVQASSIMIINSTTLTGTTPAHAAGVVNVIASTGQASSTLTNAFTYS